MELLIKGARIVDFSEDFIGDVYIKNGIIQEIGLNLKKDCKYIDGEGKVLMPSFIDLHVHFREPGYDYKEDILTGSKAAVRGGYTVVNLMANTKPVCSSMDIVDYVLDRCNYIGLVDAHQVVSITKDFDGKTLTHLDKLDNRVKIISEDGKDVMNSKVMLDAMMKAKEKNITVMCHSENHELSSEDTELAEDTMTWRNITLAKYTRCKTHIAHVSTKNSLMYIKQGKEEGFKITCEVTPHHIILNEGSDYKVNPPMRNKEHVKALIEGIKNGTVDTISTDHAPHSKEDKLNGAPGISGIETAFSICYTNLVKNNEISLNKLSEIMSRNPAKILNLNKGEIKVGKDADLVLVDLQNNYEIDSKDFLSKGKNTPFNGMKVYGKITNTFKCGREVYSVEKGGVII